MTTIANENGSNIKDLQNSYSFSKISGPWNPKADKEGGRFDDRADLIMSQNEADLIMSQNEADLRNEEDWDRFWAWSRMW